MLHCLGRTLRKASPAFNELVRLCLLEDKCQQSAKSWPVRQKSYVLSPKSRFAQAAHTLARAHGTLLN